MAELETRELENVPIFSAGTWTNSAGSKRTWTEDDLDEMVENAGKLADKVIPFLRVDHTDEKTHKRITGRFKIGDLTNVRRVGKQLVADIVKIPRKAYELMKAGIFGRPSAEIFPTFKDEASGATFKNVLSGAAILSGKHPAVTTLDDIYDLFGMAIEFHSVSATELFEWRQDVDHFAYVTQREDGKWVVKDAGYGPDVSDVVVSVWETEEEAKSEVEKRLKAKYTQATEGGDDMTPEEVKKIVDEAVAKATKEQADKVAELSAALEAEKTRADSATGEIAKHDAADFSRDYDALIAKAKGEGRLTPAQEPALKTMVDGWKLGAKDGKIEFQSGAEKKSGSILEAFGAYLDALPVVVKLGEQGTQTKPDEARGGDLKVKTPRDVERYMKREGIEHDTDAAELNEKVLEVKRQRNMTYEQALNEVTGASEASEPSPITIRSDKVKE